MSEDTEQISCTVEVPTKTPAQESTSSEPSIPHEESTSNLTSPNTPSLHTPSIPILSPQTSLSLPTTSLPLLSPQCEEDDVTHSNMTTPSLPSLSPALTRLSTPLPPSTLLSPLPARKIKETRRESGEGKLLRPDPMMSQPLSVLIPSEGKSRKRTSPRSNKGLKEDSTTSQSPVSSECAR